MSTNSDSTSPEATPKYQRKKEDRPEEIALAALEEFSEKGYSATRIQDVAKRAGVSKGLMYLYYKTKEELFKAIIKTMIAPRVLGMEQLVKTTDLKAEDILRGPLIKFATDIQASPMKRLAPMIIAEGRNHPDLVNFYWEHVLQHGIGILKSIIQKGIDDGDFHPSVFDDIPHLIVTPVLFSVLWNNTFGHLQSIEAERAVRAHIEMVIMTLKTKNQPEPLR